MTSSFAFCEFTSVQEVKDTNDKRESLFVRITDISHDLCATVLRMEATNHLDLVGRLKTDIDKYAKLIEFPRIFCDRTHINEPGYSRRLPMSSKSPRTAE